MSAETSTLTTQLRANVLAGDLSQALKEAKRSVARKGRLPVLTHVLVEGTDDGLRLVTTNRDRWTVASLPGADVGTEGAAPVPLKNLEKIVKTFSKDLTVTLEATDDGLALTCGSARYALEGLSPDEFPSRPDFIGADTFSLPAAELYEVAKRVSDFASKDVSRAALNHVRLQLTEDATGFRATATSGHKLLEYTRLGADLEGVNDLLVPAPWLKSLRAWLRKEKEDLHLCRTNAYAALTAGDVTHICRTSEGPYPNTDQVKPRAGAATTCAVVESEALLVALDKVEPVAPGDSHHMKLFLDPDENIRLTASSPELGEVTVRLPAEAEGEPLRIAFNLRHLRDTVKALGAERVKLLFTGAERAAVVLPEAEDSGWYGLVVPLRIPD